MHSKSNTMRHYKYFLLFILSGLAFALDQITKLVIQTHFQIGQSLYVLPIFNITYVQNVGGAFGIFRESPDSIKTVLFLIFTNRSFCYHPITIKTNRSKTKVANLLFGIYFWWSYRKLHRSYSFKLCCGFFRFSHSAISLACF